MKAALTQKVNPNRRQSLFRRRAASLCCGFFVLLVSGFVSPGSAATFYVATSGHDTNAGTLAAPWRTIQKAGNTLVPGDTALVRGGIYAEAVTVNMSGNAAAGPVTFQNYPGETPVVDGAGLIVPEGNAGLFLITGRSHVTIQGFEIRNYQTNSRSLVPAGIWISGAAHNINIISNRIHDIGNEYHQGSTQGNAFGLAVYGNTLTPITNLVIRGNELFNLRTGTSESLVLNGNVANFEVSGNRIHDNYNIGIDFIGYERTCPDANLDRARQGVCRDNVVWNCSTFRNPAYKEYSCAGIYVDGGTDILIESNRTFRCDIGVELAAEHKGRATSFITLRSNLIWSNSMGGIFLGGYSSKVGRTENCTITHNTLVHNDTLQWGQGEVLFQFDTRSNTFTHNLLVLANWENNLFIGNPFTQNTSNVVDSNQYFMTAPGSPENTKWQWKKTKHTGFANYQRATGNDSNSECFVKEEKLEVALRAIRAATDAAVKSSAIQK
jgi:hypothetical protein